MTIEEIQTICHQLPGTTEDIKWDTHLCFNVGGKMYLVTSPDDVPASASFIAPPEEFEILESSPGFSRNKYMARYGWVNIDNIRLLTHAQWEQYIRHSYQTVVAKLLLKMRKQLGAVV